MEYVRPILEIWLENIRMAKKTKITGLSLKEGIRLHSSDPFPLGLLMIFDTGQEVKTQEK